MVRSIRLFYLKSSFYREILPDVCVSVFSKTFIVESVDLGDLTGLVVAAQYRDALAVTDLKKSNYMSQSKSRLVMCEICLDQCFPTFFGSRHPYLVLKIFGGTPGRFISFKDQ